MATVHCKDTIPKQILPEKELHGHSRNLHIHMSVNDLYIPTIDLPILLQEKYVDRSREYINRRHMNVEIGSEAAQFPERNT